MAAGTRHPTNPALSWLPVRRLTFLTLAERTAMGLYCTSRSEAELRLGVNTAKRV
jgi:hypothetical protein